MTCLKAEMPDPDLLTQINCGAAGSHTLEWAKEDRRMRFYFDIADRLSIRDQVGRDFKQVSEAVVYAKYLAADLRCLEPDIRPLLSVRVFGEGLEQIHEEAVFT